MTAAAQTYFALSDSIIGEKKIRRKAKESLEG